MESRECAAQWKEVMTNALRKNTYRTECGYFCGISLAVHADNALLKAIAESLSNYCEREDTFLED